jgi:hypothetical protein
LPRGATCCTGILNGIDTTLWDPRRDPLIPANYDADALDGEAVDKQALRDRFLNQMYSQRYGRVPIVDATGGLIDSVVDCTDATLEAGTAIGFHVRPIDAEGLRAAFARAVAAYRDTQRWRRLQRNGKDFGWRRSAAEYARLYRGRAGGTHARERRDRCDHRGAAVRFGTDDVSVGRRGGTRKGRRRGWAARVRCGSTADRRREARSGSPRGTGHAGRYRGSEGLNILSAIRAKVADPAGCAPKPRHDPARRDRCF